MMELMRVPPQNPIYNNPMLQIAVAQNMHNVDNFAVWDRNKVIKLVTGVGLSIILLYVLERFGNGNHINPPVIPPNPSTVNPSSLLVASTPQTLKPCVPTITAYRVILEGNCNNEEIDAAYAKSSLLFDKKDAEVKADSLRIGEEISKKLQDKIEENNADNVKRQLRIDQMIAERDQLIIANAKFVRELFPTPEEKAFKEAVQRIEIDCLMDKKFFGWPGYEPIGCELDGLNLLDAKDIKTCDELKSRYRKVSLKYHPDKNNSTEAMQKFINITNVFKKICLL